MELITYNATTIEKIGCRGLKPVISISSKSGAIRFSRSVASMLNIDQNKIAFVQDKSRPQDWYLTVDNSDAGLTVRRSKPSTNGNNGQWIIQSTWLARRILTACGIDEASCTFPVAVKPIENGGGNLYAIITKAKMR